jgi:HAE1 family hydrophobic/amphiphilic exporter-1
MRAYELTINDVTNALRQQNLELPGGRVQQGATELTVRTMGRIVDPEAFNDLAIATREGYSVKLRDIGAAVDAAEEQRTSAKLNGQAAVTLIVQKQSGKNTVAVADAVKQRLQEIQEGLPRGYRTQVVGDQSVFIKHSLEAIQTHLIEGGVLAALVVFLFLRTSARH